MAFVKKLLQLNKGKKKLAEVLGETSKVSKKITQKIHSKIVRHPVGDDKPSDLLEDEETAGLPKAEKPADISMEDEKTAGLPGDADLTMGDKKTADVAMVDDKAVGELMEDDPTASPPMEDNKTAGLMEDTDLNMEDEKTAGLFMEDNKIAGLPTDDNKAADLSMEAASDTELATFALGCFWQPESQFGCAPGVLKTKVGYTGGNMNGPTHSSLADHMESVEITFDPKVTDYSCMLNLFWDNHDPTRNVSSQQYKSAIFYHSGEQKKLAEESSTMRQQKLVSDILTKIMEAETFYNAENNHQKYHLRRQQTILESIHLSDSDIITSYIACRINGFCGGNGTLEQLESELPSFKLTPKVEQHLRKIVSCGPLH